MARREKHTHVIDRFVDEDYSMWQGSLQKLAKEVEKICRRSLDSQKPKIDYVVSSRVKDRERLRTKLRNQQEKRDGEYKDRNAILDDIFDFVGVRIALYRPEERDRVRAVLYDNFKINEKDDKYFPEHGQVTEVHQIPQDPSYTAYHCIARVYQHDMPDLNSDSRPVEIQVMSVLQSSWAQIQHDLVYKQLSGHLSDAEKNSIDSLARTIKLGESFLLQLSDSFTTREALASESFSDIYDLGSCVSKWFEREFKQKTEDMGSLKALKALLSKFKIDNRKELETILEGLGPQSSSWNTARTYYFADMELQPSVYIMDHIRRDPKFTAKWKIQRTQLHRTETRYTDMLQIIMSTILWLIEFFPQNEWEAALSSPGTETHNKIRVDYLSWLGSVNVPRLVEVKPDFKQRDMDSLNELWQWFDKHHHSAIQLAFQISKLGITHNVTKEVCRFIRAFSWLCQRLQDEKEFEESNGNGRQ